MPRPHRSGLAPPRASVLLLFAVAAAVSLIPDVADAQYRPSGGLDFDLAYWMDRDRASTGLISRMTAMATDQVRGTVVGRFAELRLGAGTDFDANLMPYELHFKLGVGVATDYFRLFLASGILLDAHQALREEAKDRDVPFGAGIPATFGLWVTPIDDFYLYATFEPAWYFGVESRQVDAVKPLDLGEEARSRVGLGYTFETLHFRLEYIHHQVAPASMHVFTFGVGYTPDLPELP